MTSSIAPRASALDLAMQPRSFLVPSCAYCGLDVIECDDARVRRPGMTDDDAATHCEKSHDHLHSVPVDPPEHVCYEGPLCEFWSEFHPRSGSTQDDDPMYCGHSSCMQVLMSACEACQVETMIEAAEDIARWADLSKTLDSGLCPGPAGKCGQPVTYRAHIAAPGYGHSYECAAGHVWIKVGPTWMDTAPELIPADVI